MPTDREYLKAQQAGALGTTGATDAIGEVGKAHQQIISFEVTSDASMAEIGIRLDKKCIVKSAHFTPAVALAANGSSYTTYTLRKRDGAGGSAVTVGSLDTNSAGQNVSLAQFVPSAFTLTAANVTVAAGNILTFQSAETGTPTSPIGKVSVVVEYV